MDRLFGPVATKQFNFYREIAIEYKHIDYNGTQLTPQGQRIVNNWKRFKELIYSVE